MQKDKCNKKAGKGKEWGEAGSKSALSSHTAEEAATCHSFSVESAAEHAQLLGLHEKVRPEPTVQSQSGLEAQEKEGVPGAESREGKTQGPQGAQVTKEKTVSLPQWGNPKRRDHVAVQQVPNTQKCRSGLETKEPKRGRHRNG